MILLNDNYVLDNGNVSFDEKEGAIHDEEMEGESEHEWEEENEEAPIRRETESIETTAIEIISPIVVIATVVGLVIAGASMGAVLVLGIDALAGASSIGGRNSAIDWNFFSNGGPSV